MMRLALAAALATLVPVSGCGGSAGARESRVDVRIELTTYVGVGVGHPRPRTQAFTLVCEPTSGTLPLAASVCDDIRRYPGPMLDPGRPHWVCTGYVFGPALMVVAKANGATTRFGGEPFCDWPGGTALGVYYEAATRDVRVLAKIEPRLRCDEAPVLHESSANITACTHGLWTARSERLIREAERVPEIAGLVPERLFPSDIGAEDCTIPAGGPPPDSERHGRCQITLKNTGSVPTVDFVEDWPLRAGGNGSRAARHIWRVLITKSGATLLSQSGPVPPQLWR